MHDNDPSDERYRSFLSRLWSHLRPLLEKGECGLDYGCGPGPALAQMMTEDGFCVEKYDLYFFPGPESLAKTYDFITCTETIEHLRNPKEVFALFDSMLRPLGKVGLMTGVLNDRTAFGDWHYQRDPTHIAFYTHRTFVWIATQMGWDFEYPTNNVAIFTKRGKCQPTYATSTPTPPNPTSRFIPESRSSN